VRRRWTHVAPPVLGGALAAALAATIAVAAVIVYANDFSSKGEYREIKGSGGKHCERAYAGKAEHMRAVVVNGPETCRYSPPVRSDGPQPDQVFQAEGKALRSTPKSIRDKAFLFITARTGGGDHYELRIFPSGHRWKLSREPAGDGFPVDGKSKRVRSFEKRNAMRLDVKGARVTAKVNGGKLASLTDPSPNELKGGKLEFGVGSKAGARKNTVAAFTKLKVAVPKP
jgi:hypothetical protein